MSSIRFSPASQQYMAAKYLGIDLLKPALAFGVTVPEWILWIGSMVHLGTRMFLGGLTLPVLLGMALSISLLLIFFLPKPATDKQPPETAC